MQSPNIDAIDEIILEEFPYPVAVAYDHLLRTTDLAKQAKLCLQVFHFSIRSIAFALLIEYLQEPAEVLNSVDLNSRIQQNLKKSPTGYWVEMLCLALNVYQDRRDRFFMPELYDLRYADADRWAAVLQLMNDLAVLRNDLLGGLINGAAIAPELLGKLKALLSHFEFIRRYELWYIRAVNREQRHLVLDVFQGKDEPAVQDVPEHVIVSPHFDRIKPGQFYLHNQKHELIRLHPLIISSETMKSLSDLGEGDIPDKDTGVYDAFRVRGENEGLRRDELIYRLMKAFDQEQHVSGDLVALFRDLYDTFLSQKEHASSARLSPDAGNIKFACQHYSDGQISPARSKYLADAYLERVEFDALFQAFMQQSRPAIVISGGVGVGKTNFLVHYYDTEIRNRPDLVPLWIDGTTLDVQKSLSQSLLNAWEQVIAFEALPTEEDGANRLLRDLLVKYLPEETLVILIDAVNENNRPMEAIGRINDFLLTFPGIDRVKVIMTTRPQVWQWARDRYLKTRFKPTLYFSAIPVELGKTLVKVENDSFVLQHYSPEELPEAFERYAEHYHLIDPDLSRFTPALRKAMQDPLQLRLICDAHDGRKVPPQRIPDSIHVDDIIPTLIDNLVKDPNTAFEKADFTFLIEQIVPQFVPKNNIPVAKLTRGMLMDVHVGNRTLDDLVDDSTPYSDGTRVNARAQRLLDTGWLVRTEADEGYELRFRYEYFYDYFVGTYLAKRYAETSDKLPFFQAQVSNLTKVPFLWGPTCRLLVELLKNGEREIIEKLGYTDDVFQYEVLVSVLIGRYSEYVGVLHPILLAWLSRRASETLGPRIAANVAVECRVEDILRLILAHPNKAVRFLVVQDIHKVWQADAALTIRLLHDLSTRIHLLTAFRDLKTIETLLRCSLLLLMYDYWEHGAETETVKVLQDIWRPVIRRLLLVSRVDLTERVLRRARRVFIRILVSAVVSIFKGISTEFFFNMEDLQKCFPLTPLHRQIFEQLMPHVDAAAGQTELTADELADSLRELAKNHVDDYMTIGLAAVAMVSQYFREPLAATRAISRLIRGFEDFYPRTENADLPTATVWLPMMLMPLGNILSFVDNLPPESAKEMVDAMSEIYYTAEDRYRSVWRFHCGAILRTPPMNTALICRLFGYPELVFTEQDRLVQLIVGRQDYKRLRHFLGSLCDTTFPVDSAEILYVALQSLKHRLKHLDAETSEQVWNMVIDDLTEYAVYLGDSFTNLVERVIEDDDIPLQVKARLRAMGKRENFDYAIGIAVILFGVAAFKNRDAFIRDKILKWGFNKALTAKSFNQWIVECIAYVGNMVYGGSLITE